MDNFLKDEKKTTNIFRPTALLEALGALGARGPVGAEGGMGLVVRHAEAASHSDICVFLLCSCQAKRYYTYVG